MVPRLDFEKHYPTLSDPEVSTYKNCKSIQLVIEKVLLYHLVLNARKQN